MVGWATAVYPLWWNRPEACLDGIPIPAFRKLPTVNSTNNLDFKLETRMLIIGVRSSETDKKG
jgi:hypothetical protein